MRTCKAVITMRTAKQGAVQFPVQRVQAYTTDQSIDNDVDSFSVDIVDRQLALVDCVNRDTEVQVDLFLDNQNGVFNQIFSGFGDVPQYAEDYTISIAGRDVPSAIAVDSDALPTWIAVGTDPKSWIEARAMERGITKTKIAGMSLLTKRAYTDGTETEWALWYRIARMRDMYMWSDSVGTLIIDVLGYALAPSYKFGHPPTGQSNVGWIPVEPPLLVKSNKQQRIRQEIVYGQTGTVSKKDVQGFVTQSLDTTIASWQRKPRKIVTATKGKIADRPKTIAEAQHDSDLDIFESIVGAQEITLTVQDANAVILQNRMCQVNLPEYGIIGNYFIVGVARAGGTGASLVQTIRLRERGFALTKRVPDSPTLPKTQDSSGDSSTGIASALSGIRWADSFVKAAREFGVAAGWDLSVFLGVLLAICQQETGFHNERQDTGHYDHTEWYAKPTASDPITPSNPGSSINPPPFPGPNLTPLSLAQRIQIWQETFANDGNNSLNPMQPNEAGEGPMQLTSPGAKAEADTFGWNGTPAAGEYDGGRWNPDSNIRAAAHLLVEKLQENPPANPTDSSQIWIGVQRYNGSGPAAIAYAAKVKAIYDTLFSAQVTTAIASVNAITPSDASKKLIVPGHGTIVIDPTAPVEVARAINWCLKHLGDPYQYGGYGPYYDCSSFVTEALQQAAGYLAKMMSAGLGAPNPATKSHGQTTYTLWDMGTSVPKDALFPGDLVFFLGDPPDHVGMYMGDGLFIADPHTGTVVTVSSMGEDYYVQNYSGARRLINWANTGA